MIDTNKINVDRIEQEASWISKRLSEPSTYAGLGMFITVIGLHFTNTQLTGLQEVGQGLGLVIGGILAIVIPEKK